MGKIHVLTAEIISKIAAGEVIERPASVVKELIENSLDAKTTSIELHLKQAGKTLIRIKDTGNGIEPEDIEKVFIRHSTSKIKEISDLEKISSLGFRGEALYSIAAISDVILNSKSKSADTGWQVHCRGNKKISHRPVPLLSGTEIEVKELFFNTPARKKFLKSDSAELKQILNIFIPYTLLYPQIRFLLTHNGRKLLDLPPEKNNISRIAKALNLEEKYILEEKRGFPEENVFLHLILGDMNIHRTNKDMQFIFINERPVQNRGLSFHLNEVYKLILSEGMRPFFAVDIKMPAENLDVNVHPSKREVKIKDEFKLVSLLRFFCEHTLMSYGKAKQAKPIFQFEQAPGEYREKETDSSSYSKISDAAPKIYPAFSEKDILLFSDKINIPRQKNTSLKTLLNDAYYIGAFQKKYLIFAANKSLLIIDQHAAHERINYEKLKQQIESGKVEIQNLLTPVLIRLTRQEMLSWEEIKDKLEELGFSTTSWDKETIAIHSHPQLINTPETAVRNILSDKDNANHDTNTLARRACRQSIMAGNEVKKEEADSLRNQLLQCDTPFTCPHGRPTLIEIEGDFINKQFLRN